MTTNSCNPVLRYYGRAFSREEMDRVRRLIASHPNHNRVQLSRLVCNKLGWISPNGRPKEMSCRVAMLRMERDGLITLPPPEKGNGRTRPRLTSASDPKDTISLPAGALGELIFRPVNTRQTSSLWNEFIECYHYLGYKPLPGAQIGYLVFGEDNLLALLGFGASAWSVAPRDRFIGWTSQQRISNLHLVVNNARFLILPWVKSTNLASRILGGIAKRFSQDWQTRYGYQPALLETFVEKGRFRGTSYRAASWIYVGQTQGRGKVDRKHDKNLPVKDIYLYPLHKQFQQKLCS